MRQLCQTISLDYNPNVYYRDSTAAAAASTSGWRVGKWKWNPMTMTTTMLMMMQRVYVVDGYWIGSFRKIEIVVWSIIFCF